MDQLDDMAAPSKAVRDLNKDFVRRLSAVMSEEDKAKFEYEFAKRAHPRIYRETYPQQCFTAVMAFSDLDDSQRDAIKTMQEQYNRELRAANAEWAKAVESAEDVAGGSMGLQMAQWMPSEKEGIKEAQESVKTARDARRELDNAMKARLEQTLKLEQRNRLPSRKATQDNPWEMFSQPEDDE
jgi:hypothetical protein